MATVAEQRERADNSRQLGREEHDRAGTNEQQAPTNRIALTAHNATHQPVPAISHVPDTGAQLTVGHHRSRPMPASRPTRSGARRHPYSTRRCSY